MSDNICDSVMVVEKFPLSWRKRHNSMKILQWGPPFPDETRRRVVYTNTVAQPNNVFGVYHHFNINLIRTRM